MIIRNVDVRQIQSGEELPQFIPLFKINRGEHDELSTANSTYSFVDFDLFIGGYDMPRASYTFAIEKNYTNQKSIYYLRAKKQEKTLMCYTTEDDEFIYVCVKVEKTYYPIHAELRINPTAQFMYTPCSYANSLDPDAYEFKSPATEDNIIIRDSINNHYRATSNSIMHTSTISSGQFMKFAEFLIPSETTERSSNWELEWIYGELLLYFGGLYVSTKPAIVRLNILVQGMDNVKIYQTVVSGKFPYTLKCSRDDKKVYAYLSKDPNSRPTVAVLACNMMKGNVAILTEMCEELVGEEFEPIITDIYPTE
ncbi:MAG: hypothetical protein MJZ20_05760 [Bacteroidaceae bacterium]|nr:hypothetical protein [Bacteroidaceae bacterium]